MSNADSDNMDTPITKREALELFLTKREFHDVMKNLFDYLDKRFSAADTRVSELEANTHRLVREMGIHFAHETQAVVREVSLQHRADLAKVDEKYNELPERVTRVEDAVSGPSLKR